MKTVGVSINTKMSLLIMVMILVCSVSIGIFSYAVYRQDCFEYKKEAALNVAETLAAAVNGDELAIIDSTGEQTEYYDYFQEIIIAARERSKMEYLYVIVDNGDGLNYKYIFDADELFGELDLIEDYGAEQTFLNGESSVTTSTSDEYGTLISAFAAIEDSGGNFVGAVGADIDANDVVAEVYDFGYKVALAIVLFNILFFYLTKIYTDRSLGRPIKQLAQMGESLAQGNLDVHANIKSKDEIGLLHNSFMNVSQTLNRLISRMEEMTEEQSGGNYDAYIDSQEFKGAYCTVVSGINKMVADYVSEIKEIIDAVSALGDGDFDTELRKFPGKKESVNVNIEALRKTFKELNNEIRRLAVSASNGDLSRKIMADNFKGSWYALAQELDNLLLAVNKPIQEAQEVLQKMSGGDFSARMHGEYNGAFGIIKDGINSTQAAISSYISEISSILSQMSAQNLNVAIERQYIGDFSIIKDSINMIIGTFNEALTGINSSAEQVALGSRQISDLSANLARGASEQTGAVTELNSVIERISMQAESSAATASEANSLMLSAREELERESTTMRKMLTAMEEINESTQSISQIMKVIEDIAFQTNLLALNAAVEAARAGEHGRGFAVVAEEVGNLAGRSQKAAKETADLITDSVAKVSDGVQAANRTSKGLGIIADKISDVSERITKITESSAEQNESIIRINDEISQVSKVAQENTAISEECAASSEELSSQAEVFKDTVSKFILAKQ